jgi:hypothetical protein
MANRRDQHVTLEHRAMIQKSDQLIGTGHHGGRDLAARNLAEHVSHRTNAKGGVIERTFDRLAL